MNQFNSRDDYDYEAERQSLSRRFQSGEIDENTFTERLGVLLVRQSLRVRFDLF